MWSGHPPFSKPWLIFVMSQPNARLAALFSLCFAALSVFGQTPPPGNGSSPCTAAEIRQGLVVESVAKNSEGEKAGLAQGDIVLGWSRGDAKGKIESPFDLSEIETEQEPRGPVTLVGTRTAVKQSWVIGPDKWDIQARPDLQGNLLTIYLEGEKLAKAHKLSEAAVRWREIVNEGRKHKCPSLGAWALAHAAQESSDAQIWNQADKLYQDAIQEAPSFQPHVRARLLLARAELFEKHSDWSNVENYYQQALNESLRFGAESLSAASCLSALGQASLRQGDLTKAEERQHRALEIREKLGPDSLVVARSLTRLGQVAFDRGDARMSEEYYRKALAIEGKQAPEGFDAAASLNGLGILSWGRGDLGGAEEHFHEALVIVQKLLPGTLKVADLLNNIAVLDGSRGDLQKAEERHSQVLAIRERLVPDSLDVANSLNNLGLIAAERGDATTAGGYYRRALAICEKRSPNSVALAQSLNNVGTAAEGQGDLVEAEQYFRRALTIYEKLAPGGLEIAAALHNLGDVAWNRGDLDKAGEYCRRALAIEQETAPDGLWAGESLNRLGDVAARSGDLAKAEGYYRQALTIRQKSIPGTSEQAESLAALGAIMRQRQQFDVSVQFFREALNALESQTAHLGGTEDLRSRFRANRGGYYKDYIDVLMAQKQPELAFEALERSRARTLLEMLNEARVDVREGIDPSLLERERSLRRLLSTKSSERIEILSGRHTEEQLARINQGMDQLLAQHQELDAQIRASSPSYAALAQPQPLSAKDVQQQLLDADTMILEYVLGEKRSFVFVLTPASLDSYELPKRSEVEDIAHHVYDLLASRNRWIESETSTQRKVRMGKAEAEYEKTAAILSQMILAPIAARLEGKRLLIVADGALQYVPFAVLPVPARDRSKPSVPLVAEHEILNLPSASVLALLRQQANGRAAWPREVVVLADPVFDKADPRVRRAPHNKQVIELASEKEIIPTLLKPLTRSLRDVGLGTREAGFALPRLAFSRREADAIMAMTNPVKGMKALDFQASRETALSKDLRQYRIVHFATHGLLNNEHPELSGLVLSLVDSEGKSRDGFLDLEDVYNLTLPADLVVLSACETGLGKQINGEGLVGLTRGFMYAGATRVVASLWKVDDVATADLMGRFYRGMLKEGLRPAAALRQAQTEMQKQKRWTDPYYWAAFTIQGEWK